MAAILPRALLVKARDKNELNVIWVGEGFRDTTDVQRFQTRLSFAFCFYFIAGEAIVDGDSGSPLVFPFILRHFFTVFPLHQLSVTGLFLFYFGVPCT